MSQTRSVTDVDVHEAQRLADAGALLLDVREPHEWAAGHIAGSTHLPLGLLEASRVPADRRVVAVCRSGNRSGQAAAVLQAAGHDVVNMAGGVLAWTAAGLPLVTTDGAEAPR